MKSNNRLMTSLDWRANRLADKLALFLNPPTPLEKAGEDLVKSAKAAAKYKLSLLGRVTHEANNYKCSTTDSEGVTHTVTMRDSVSKPEKTKGKKTVKKSKDKNKILPRNLHC